MKIAVYNPSGHWHQMAWALVTTCEEARSIGVRNGFFSWKLEDNTKDWDIFKGQVKQLS